MPGKNTATPTEAAAPVPRFRWEVPVHTMYMAMSVKTPSRRPARSLRLAEDPPFGKFARQVGHVVNHAGRGMYSFSPCDTWTPDVNLLESASAYLVCVDLAGVEKESIDLTVVNQRLTLRGVRDVPRPPAEPAPTGKAVEEGRVRVHLMEIDHGSFCREVELPADIDRERIAANYLNGMLWITLPKR